MSKKWIHAKTCKSTKENGTLFSTKNHLIATHPALILFLFWGYLPSLSCLCELFNQTDNLGIVGYRVECAFVTKDLVSLKSYLAQQITLIIDTIQGSFKIVFSGNFCFSIFLYQAYFIIKILKYHEEILLLLI